MPVTQFLEQTWPYLVVTADLALALVASAHVVIYKRDLRAAIGWAGLIWLSPFLGAAFYALFGVNRLKRRASKIRQGHPSVGHDQAVVKAGAHEGVITTPDPGARPTDGLPALQYYVTRATGVTITHGNQVEPLQNGDEAYPAMLEAIERAERSVALCTYIFDNDRAGKWFVDALADAARRGVDVRVLIDGAGSRYSHPPVPGLLRAAGVPVAVFLKSLLPLRNPYLNMRNHRKILVADGRTGFTGGLNIREGCVLDLAPEHPVRDTHFRFHGPVVHQMLNSFAVDWAFTTGETLRGDRWYPALSPVGDVTARGIADGPDEDFETIKWVMLGALSRSREHVMIATPYFLPDQTFIAALNLTAMRGVRVDIVLPAHSNLRFVDWAAMAQAWQLLERGCRIWLAPPPFDHSKLMVVDRTWSFVGSANWDPRSLRLNFEFNVECYDSALALNLADQVQAKIDAGRALSLEEANGRRLPVKLRDGVTRLFSPYL